MLDEQFYHTWLLGFSQGLEELGEESRSCFLKPCAKRCADSGVLEAYRQHYVKVNGNRDEFYERLNELCGVFGRVIVSQKEYEICFPTCLCDLHTTGGVNTPSLCECSRQSILYVAQKIWNTTEIMVECLGTVLSGQKECKFRVCFQ